MSKLIKWPKNNHAGPPDMAGFVERAAANELAGWAVSRTGAPVELALRIDGALFAADATWSARPDVAAKLGANDPRVGFVIHPAGPVKEHISRAIQEGRPFDVVANGVVLPLAKGVVPVLSVMQGGIDAMNRFTLSGWAVTSSAPVTAIELFCNGTPVESAVIRRERRDVAEALGIEALETGFDIELPGSIWNGLTETGACRLELRCDGALLASKHLELDRAGAAAWVADIARMEAGPEKRYRALVALEHVRFGGLFPRLNAEAGRFVRAFAGAMRLEELVSPAAEEKTRTGSRAAKNLALLKEQALRRWTSPDAPEQEATKVAIEAVNHFTISGWAAVGNAPVSTFELSCNGTPVECAVIRTERRDVAEALGIEDLGTGFEVELPGFIWEGLPETAVCRLELCGDGALLTPQPVELSRARAAGWVAGIAHMEAGPEKQYRALTALEHIRYGGLFSRLDAETALFVRTIVRQMHLEDFVFAGEAVQAQTEDAPAEYASTLLLWKTMRELNAELEDPGLGTYEAVMKVLGRHRLQGIVKEWYLNLAAQVTCDSGEFLLLRKSEDFRYLYQFEESSQPHQMSLLLPLLVADGFLDRATALLERLSGSLSESWLHTGCVRFAVEHFQRLEAEGEVDIPTGEKFRRAFIDLLESYQGEWFSRLHDRELVDAMVSLLVGLPHYTDLHQDCVVAAAIQHYGLCPTFWQRLAVRLPSLPHSELVRAGAAWQALSASLEMRQTPPADRLKGMLDPIAYFIRQGNPEALMVLREVTANNMPALNRELSDAGKTLIATLLAADPVEALRIATFPLAKPNALQARFHETSDGLFRTLRRFAGYDKSVVFELQCSAAGILRSAQEAAKTGDLNVLESALAQLEREAVALANLQGSFLGTDLLASAYVLSVNAGLTTDTLLMRMGQMVRQGVHDSEAEGYLPPPVCSALERLAGMKDDIALRGFLAEMRAVIRGKFGPKHDLLFTPPAAPALVVTGTGWPQDTLVVIYSCRKYLDTRVKAIRETWMQDLKARGIPCLVLVGEGNDTLQGDVLALRVSDEYEELPKKTLKLFDWVYDNTDARYVLKIEDDCYLDAARYFDTLSYRKHFYYGRVIRSDAGALDRTRHQSRAHTTHGQKTIDKSPEPSVYADGHGAYCLSRFALLHLRKAASTAAGKRLIAGSCREDKLVGDLLALAQVPPRDEDYETHQQHRTHEKAMPIAMGANSFFPGRHAPTKVAHLGSDEDFPATREKSGGDALWPKKIWPTCCQPSIKSNGNQLEMLSDALKAERLMVHNLVVVSVVRNEITMLPHFLEYYRRLGVKCFIFADNCSDDGTREYLVSQPDAVVYSADTEYRHSHYGVTWQQAVLGNHCLGKWVVLADADEFLVYENSETVPLPELIGSLEAEKSNGALIYMIDMYPYGDLGDARLENGKPFDVAPHFDKEALIELRFGGGSYSNSRNFVNGLRHRIAPTRINAYVSQKYALFRYQPWVRMTEGIHYAANLTVTEKPVFFAHFKYHAGFKTKVLTEIKRKQHYNAAEEYLRYAAMLAEGQGGFGAEGVTERYRNSHTFLDLAKKLNREK